LKQNNYPAPLACISLFGKMSKKSEKIIKSLENCRKINFAYSFKVKNKQAGKLLKIGLHNTRHKRLNN